MKRKFVLNFSKFEFEICLEFGNWDLEFPLRSSGWVIPWEVSGCLKQPKFKMQKSKYLPAGRQAK